ncbi:hypothetical protein [Streptomyces sp. NPDC052225]|uniref:hypothetical protein n=1 Tax=Streptomyces sp. NPDC052225 TaxID=3154949 RepID=UPI00343399BB
MRHKINSRTAAACCAMVCLAAAAWYATQTVRPECDVRVAVWADKDGNPMPDRDGKRWTVRELNEQAYWKKVRAGECEAPSARWRQWSHL